MNPNINNISSFLTSIAEGHLYQSFYHQRMGLLRLGLVSECRVTKNTANDTYFPILFFYFSNIIVERFKTTLTSYDAKQKKWFMIPKVASIKMFHLRTQSTMVEDIYIFPENYPFCSQVPSALRALTSCLPNSRHVPNLFDTNF